MFAYQIPSLTGNLPGDWWFQFLGILTSIWDTFLDKWPIFVAVSGVVLLGVLILKLIF